MWNHQSLPGWSSRSGEDELQLPQTSSGWRCSVSGFSVRVWSDSVRRLFTRSRLCFWWHADAVTQQHVWGVKMIFNGETSAEAAQKNARQPDGTSRAMMLLWRAFSDRLIENWWRGEGGGLTETAAPQTRSDLDGTDRSAQESLPSPPHHTLRDPHISVSASPSPRCHSNEP